MCGIVGYVSNKKVPLGDIITLANFNIHRGNDGVGVVYMTDKGLRVSKMLFGLDEINSARLDKTRSNNLQRIGCIEFQGFDKGAYDKIQPKFEKATQDFLGIESNFIFVHNRKGTFGNNTKENLHPVYTHNKYYIHNGTAIEAPAIKTYLELTSGYKFKTDTDTEVLAIIYNKLKAIYKNNIENIYKAMSNMFPRGWGVLIEIDKKSNVTIIRDYSRELWRYTSDEDDSTIFISEPIEDLDEFKSVALINQGIYNISKLSKKDLTDETENLREAIKLFKKNDSTSYAKKDNTKCDWCGYVETVVDTYYCNNHPMEDEKKKLCLGCMAQSLDKDFNALWVGTDDDMDDDDKLKKIIEECVSVDK